MKEKFKIITNNPLVQEKLGEIHTVEYQDISYEEILKMVRNYIYKNHQLLSHPLSGSVKPNETPYKSVMISKEPDKLDIQSVELIENAMQACKKFQFKSDLYKPEVYEDFQMIDFTLIDSAVPSATAW
ncbi:MAG: GrdX family protein [Lachnospiraceae bacterium]